MDHRLLAVEGFDDRQPTNIAKSYVGIDAGLKGYTAELLADGTINFVRAPTFGPADKPTGYDLDEMLRLTCSWTGRVDLVFIEEQTSYRDSGHEGNFKKGLGYGLWLMALRAARLPVEERLPQQWKKVMGILPPRAKAGALKKLVEGLSDEEAEKKLNRRRNQRTNVAKDLSRQKAASLFPSANLMRTSRCTVPDDNLCEALLLAEMARRLRVG